MVKEYNNDELAEWFRTKASHATSGEARKQLYAADNRQHDQTISGKLYFFKYDAKTKDKLEMWDKYPMCMVLQATPDGFLGLNLHYLPKGSRMTLLKSFDKYSKDYNIQSGVFTGKGVSNWELLIKSFSSDGLQSLPKKCLKRYLYSHIRSRFVEIYNDEFDKAIQLPIDIWVFKR